MSNDDQVIAATQQSAKVDLCARGWPLARIEKLRT